MPSTPELGGQRVAAKLCSPAEQSDSKGKKKNGTRPCAHADVSLQHLEDGDSKGLFPNSVQGKSRQLEDLAAKPHCLNGNDEASKRISKTWNQFKLLTRVELYELTLLASLFVMHCCNL